MSNTSSRALRLLGLLQTHRNWSGPELAEHLEVSERTLRRDVDRLRELGYPIAAQRGVDGGYQLTTGASLPPLLLEDDEAVALVIGLRNAVSDSDVVGIAEASIRALSKVVQVMPHRLKSQVDALVAMTAPGSWRADAPGVDAEALVTFALACRDGERVEFAYSDRSGATTERLVDPHRLVSIGRRWYLVAWDLSRHDWRTFRLDRIVTARSTRARFPARVLPIDAAEFVRNRIENLPARHRVEVRVFAPAEVVRPIVGWWGSVEATASSWCRLRMTSESFERPTLLIGLIGAEFEVVEPSALVDYMSEWAARFGRAGAAR